MRSWPEVPGPFAPSLIGAFYTYRCRPSCSSATPIEDLSAWVATQRGAPLAELITPRERPYPVSSALRASLGM